MIVKGKMDDEFVPNWQCCMFGCARQSRKIIIISVHYFWSNFNVYFLLQGSLFYLGLHICPTYLYLLKELGFSLAVNWQSGKAAVGISIKYVKFLIFLTFTCVVWFLYIGSETFHVLETCAIKLPCCTECSTKCHQPCSGTVKVYRQSIFMHHIWNPYFCHVCVSCLLGTTVSCVPVLCAWFKPTSQFETFYKWRSQKKLKFFWKNLTLPEEIQISWGKFWV